MESQRKNLFDTQNQLEASKAQLTQPFEQEQELHSVLTELAGINAALGVDKTGDAETLLSEDDTQKKDILELDEEDELEY